MREGIGTPRRDEGLLHTDHVTRLGTNILTQTHKGLQTQSPRERQLHPCKKKRRKKKTRPDRRSFYYFIRERRASGIKKPS